MKENRYNHKHNTITNDNTEAGDFQAKSEDVIVILGDLWLIYLIENTKTNLIGRLFNDFYLLGKKVGRFDGIIRIQISLKITDLKQLFISELYLLPINQVFYQCLKLLSLKFWSFDVRGFAILTAIFRPYLFFQYLDVLL